MRFQLNHLFAILMLTTSAAAAPTAPATRAAQKVTTTQPSDSNKKDRPQLYAACEQRIAAAKGKPVDILFIGDSITDNLTASPTPTWDSVGIATWQKHYANRNALNFGVGADRTENVLWRFDHMDIKEFHPKVSVILIGTNNLNSTADEIAAGVNAIVAKTRETFPATKIILISILPNARATKLMEDANQIIQKLGDDKTIFYFDLAAKMPRQGDNWKGLGKDKLHPSPEGYELWATEMEPLLTKLLQQNP